MANGNVKVTTDELSSALGQFNTARGNVEAAILRMGDAVATLTASWNGAAADTFDAKFNELKANLKSCDPAIADAVAFLQNANEQYETAEREAEQITGTIEVNNPFTA